MTRPAFLESVRQYIAAHDLLPDGAPVLVGVSGGVDSMTLAYSLLQLGYPVVAVHVNYGVRGAASDADEALVRQWCAHQEPPVPLHVDHVDIRAQAEATGTSVQEAARDARYHLFRTIAEAEGIRHVAVAHHRDDQAETVLLNLFRGSGPEGLAGMAPTRFLHLESTVRLIRPLLHAQRIDIEAVATEAGIPWRTDASNQASIYRRNAIRTQIMPLIETHFEGASAAIARAGDLMRAYVEDTLREELDTRFAACAANHDPDGGLLDASALQKQPLVWQQRLILEALARWCPGAPQTEALAGEVQSLVGAQVGRRVETGAGAVWRERAGLRFIPAEAALEPLAPTSVAWGEPVAVPDGSLLVEHCDEPPTLNAGTPHVAYADADRMDESLTVRSWQPGDRFQPLGMQHTKKVSDFLTDAQVPAHRKAAALILCSGERIVWVVGYRLDERVRVRPGTRRYAKLTFRPHENE